MLFNQNFVRWRRSILPRRELKSRQQASEGVHAIFRESTLQHVCIIVMR
jgi:hypothetical protein